MAKGSKTKTTMSPYLHKPKRKKARMRNKPKKMNGMQKKAQMQGVVDRVMGGFQRR